MPNLPLRNKNVKLVLPRIRFHRSERTVPALRLLAFVVVFAGIGTYVLIASHADSFSDTTIVSKNSGQCLDVYEALQTAGTNVQQWPCHGGTNQAWQLKTMSTGYYEIISKNSGQCLDVYRALKTEGANVQQWPCWGGPNQQWSLKATSNGYYEIISKNSGQCLDVYRALQAPGANVQQWNCWGGPNQQWQLVAPQSAPVPTLSFNASALNVSPGGSAKLSWSSANATTCAATGSWSGSEPTSGSASTGALSANATYVLQCSGAGGSVTQSVTIAVTSPPPVTSGSGGGTTSSPTSATVSATPMGPAAPTGGWQLEYADAFGSKLTQEGGQDNTWFPNRYNEFNDGMSCGADRGFNSNEMENFTCGQVNVDPTVGAILTCSYGAPANPYTYSGGSKINYNCGDIMQNAVNTPAGYNMFSWMDPYNSGREVVAQIQVQFPPNYDADPGFWGAGSYANGQNGDEIDNFEGFGWGEAGNATDCINGNACALTWQKQEITMPTLVQAGNHGDDIEGGTTLGFNPASGIHTYDTVYYPNNTISEFVDGRLIAYNYPYPGTVFTPGSRTPELQNVQVSYGMRGGFAEKPSGVMIPDPVPTFNLPGESHNMIVRSVSFYENKSANNAGMVTTNGKLPLIAPGTTVTP
ncbi:MAG TPA: RICIN domain-containing protein [Candidatus Saccharimonadales bacterium]|nr:RICIN domain-containing protein [Candidatus Saccharimonadales bacterium]